MSIPLTNITGTVLLPDGTPAAGGRIEVAINSPMMAVDGVSGAHERVGGRMVYDIAADGTVNFNIVPNASMTPAGNFYRVQFTVKAPKATSWEEVWQLDTSPATMDIGDIPRLDTAPAFPNSLLLTPGDDLRRFFAVGPSAILNVATPGDDRYLSNNAGHQGPASSVSHTYNQLYAVPLLLPREFTFSDAYIVINVAATGFQPKGIIGIYTNKADDDPWPFQKLGETSAFLINSTGAKGAPLGIGGAQQNIVCPAGLIWLAFGHNDSTSNPALGCYGIIASFAGQVLGAPGPNGSISSEIGATQTIITAANWNNLPSTFPTAGASLYNSGTPGFFLLPA